jgi:hypothetical protein
MLIKKLVREIQFIIYICIISGIEQNTKRCLLSDEIEYMCKIVPFFRKKGFR